MTIERRPRQFLAVWSDDGQSVKGSTFEESLFVDGAFWKNELSSVPLDGFEAFGAMFSSGLQAQHDQLAEDKTKLTADLEAKTTECDKTKAALDKLTEDMVNLVAAHKTALDAKEAELTTANATIATRDATIATLSSETTTQATRITELQASNTEKQATIDAANATIVTLQAKVAALDAIKSFNPRHLASTDVLLSRLTQKETKAFYSSTDPVVLGGQALFDEYEAEGYYVDLDDAQVQGLTGYMVQIGILESMERRAVILRDATAAEAHYATV